MLGLFKSKKKAKKAKILLIDDEADLVETIQWMLQSSGYDIVSATNGKEGLELATRERPDLIVLDIRMPVMDGHEMLKRLRGNPDFKDIPVIMCTMSDEIWDITEASRYKICDYITKPFNGLDLIEKISDVLNK